MTESEPTHGSIVHIEFYSDDLEATQAFYETVFGWSFETVEGMDYLMWRAPNPPSGGLLAPEGMPGTPPSTLIYINVDELDETMEALTDNDAELLTDEMEVPKMGVFTLFQDPGGMVEAAWEDRYEGEPPEEGWPLLTDEPDLGSIVHIEFYTENAEATESLHEAVFDWEFEHMEDDDYTLAQPPTPPFGGVMEANEEMPAGTLVYLLVGDAEESCATIEAEGGQVLREPFEIEGWGTMAVFEAPGGIVQAVWEPVEEMEERAGESSRKAKASGN